MDYDHVVVGAGIQGSWTAYHLAKRGCKVLLVEQFPLPHSRGSSHGQSRIIRKAYPEEFHAAMMESAIQQWRHLEAETGEQLMIQTGLLFVAPKSSIDRFEAVMTSLTKIPKSDFKRLNPNELKASYPECSFSDDYCACVDNDAGVLRADKCVKTVQFCSHEGILAHPDTPDLKQSSQAMEDLESYIKEHFPGLDPKPALIEKCIYTMTPDEIAIMDSHPKHRNIVFGCGYSGSGFKLGPVVGEILADLAQQKKPAHDMAPFSSKRFVNV